MALIFSLNTSAQNPDFSIVVVPDPQTYNANHPEVFNSQMQWIANNASALNVLMVVGEGDMVGNDAIVTQWQNASSAVSALEQKVPYAFAIGNHDYDNQNSSARMATHFNSYFGPLRYASYAWYGGNYNGSNENFYTFFSNGTDEYMVLVLEYYPRDEVLTWAHSVLSTYANKRVIVVTHAFEGTDGRRVDVCDTQDMSVSAGNYPQAVWTKLIKQHPNVFLVLSGHLIGNGSARRMDLSDQGTLVHQIFTNFQDWGSGKEGYLRILKFHYATNTIEVLTYSPWVNAYLTTSTYQFTLPWNRVATTQVTGGFEGKVYSRECIAIPGAQVTTAGYLAVTNGGGYRLGNLPAAGYGVNASAAYYSGGSGMDTVNAGFNTQLDFLLSSTVKASCALSTVKPSVTICSPAANATVSSPVHVNAGSSSSRTLSFMQVYIDGVNQGTYYTAAVDGSYAVAGGLHRLTVQFRDSSGGYTKNSINFTVPTSTTVVITSPVNNATVASPIVVKASATASAGNRILYMNVYLDGVKAYGVSGASVSTSVSAKAGAHRVTVQAKDTAGVYAKSSVYVTVK